MFIKRPHATPAAGLDSRMPTTVLNAEMSCGGCSGATTRILSKVEGECTGASGGFTIRLPRHVVTAGVGCAHSRSDSAAVALAGVENVDASLDAQTITITHSEDVTAEQLLEKIAKWATNAGKKTSINTD